ncbi:MAG: sigma-70 family RNA polymerase sigma factor [Phycisphaerales bacterium]|nr:MAG: sigma-70 family RNA polymerase sigma factor [Phycisphaerales bacterium]
MTNDENPKMSQQDWMLMHRVASGDEDAVEELYDRFGALVFKVSRQLMPTRAEAEDAVQEIFVRLWQTADRYDPRRAKLVTWVMLIARRHLIDRMRRSAVRPTPATLEGDPSGSTTDRSPDNPPQDAERNAELLSRIAELPELQRTVIERAYLQGFTLREISEQLDAPLGTVKSALSRGLNRLRERAKKDWAG